MIRGALDRFRQGLRKTSSGLVGGLRGIFGGRVRLDADTLERIEELLISADMGVQSSVAITRNIEKRLQQEGGEATLEDVLAVIRADVRTILAEAKPRVRPPSWDDDTVGGKGRKKKGKAAPDVPAPAAGGPHVIFVVGVNGTGKTTTIAKLAHLLKGEGKQVLLAAGDTFRAAAVEQLVVWADRVGVPCVRQGPGADPAAVVFDALSAAEARGADVVIVDTAGRLHTKINLMEEIKKVKRSIAKRLPEAPHEVLLVLDATTGQNAVSQTRMFNEALTVTGLALTKLDGTAKGGIVIAICQAFNIPLRYIGIGEAIEDLQDFDPEQFVNALFDGIDATEPA